MKYDSPFLFIVILVVLLALLLLSKGVIDAEYGRYGYEEFVGSTDSVGELIIVKAEWCPHCVSATPEFMKLVNSGSVNCSKGPLKVKMLEDTNPEDKVEIKSLGIAGYPTVLAKLGNKATTYEGPRNADNIISWAATL
jgi:thiol-disulfide isomerase/thioredoxin